jgi:hypothetical protein
MKMSVGVLDHYNVSTRLVPEDACALESHLKEFR